MQMLASKISFEIQPRVHRTNQPFVEEYINAPTTATNFIAMRTACTPAHRHFVDDSHINVMSRI